MTQRHARRRAQREEMKKRWIRRTNYAFAKHIRTQSPRLAPDFFQAQAHRIRHYRMRRLP